MTGCSIADFFDLADRLPDVHTGGQWPLLAARGQQPDLWLSLGAHAHGRSKQTIPEQLALVAERPETFGTQFTTGGFGWVVVRFDGVERDELAELTFEGGG